MAVEYRNRKNVTYYLIVGETKTGKPRYYFSKKPNGTLAEEIPAGYEILESPEVGQVYLRKKTPSQILPAERELVTDGVCKYAGLDHSIVQVDENKVTVYLPTSDVDGMIAAISERLPGSRGAMEKAREKMFQSSQYAPELRFVLVDRDLRLFYVERMCYRGSVDGWISVSDHAPLETLVRKFTQHLGKESFFDLI